MAESGDDRTYVIKIQHEIINSDDKKAETPQKQIENNPNSDEGVSQEKTKESVKTKNAALSLAKQYAKKGALDAIANYGDMTGDYQTQATLSVAAELGMTAASIITNPLVGGIGAAVTYGGKFYSYIKQQKESERNSAFIRKRVGWTHGE